jgi:hypothetical protein
VRIGSSISNNCTEVNGVPQGSVLGPVYYYTLMTFADHARGASIKLFADDTNLHTVLQDDSIAFAELQYCLDAICERSNEWQLKLAPDKCIVMRIRSSHSYIFSDNLMMIGYLSHCILTTLLLKRPRELN